jgi:ubiquinone biosynthesis protein COQ9
MLGKEKKKMHISPELPLKERLIDALLRHSPFDGWSDVALYRALDDLNMPHEQLLLLFPGGPDEAMAFLHETLDVRMEAAMVAADLPTLKVRERIALGVRLRLSLLQEHKEAARVVATYLLHPTRAPMATHILYNTIDRLWRVAGDTATDYNFYTKRGLLAGVYTATLLYWLQDESVEHVETWAFLTRRIDNVMALPQRGKNLWRVPQKVFNGTKSVIKLWLSNTYDR